MNDGEIQEEPLEQQIDEETRPEHAQLAGLLEIMEIDVN